MLPADTVTTAPQEPASRTAAVLPAALLLTLTVRFLKFSKSAVRRSSWSFVVVKLPSSASALAEAPAQTPVRRTRITTLTQHAHNNSAW